MPLSTDSMMLLLSEGNLSGSVPLVIGEHIERHHHHQQHQLDKVSQSVSQAVVVVVVVVLMAVNDINEPANIYLALK